MRLASLIRVVIAGFPALLAACTAHDVRHARVATSSAPTLHSRHQSTDSPRIQAIQYTPFHGDPKYLLEGNWQSCRDETGQFGEKVYDQPQLGLEVHLGPGDEFAVFRGIQDEHRNHRSPDNLLFPDFRVRGGHQRWEFDEATLEVTRAGGSRTSCRSYWITLEPKKHTR